MNIILMVTVIWPAAKVVAAISSNFTDVVDYNDNFDGVVEVIVGVVIGICGVIVVTIFLLFGIYQLVFNKNQVQDLDAVEYSIQEEYEARINFEALENMDPEIRARIDLDLLGQLTNTSPEQLAPFKQIDTRSITGDGGGEVGSNSRPVSQLVRSSSIQSINHISLKLTKSDCPPEEDRSNYNHTKSIATPERLRRNNTLTDINSYIALDENAATVSPVKFVVRREGDDNAEELAKDFLVAVAGSLLAGTSLSDVGSQRTSPCGKLDDVCFMDPHGDLDSIPRKFEWRHRSICVEKMTSTEVKEMKIISKRECVSEGGANEKGRGREGLVEEVGTTEPRWSNDFNLGEECFAEIERRRAGQQQEKNRCWMEGDTQTN